MTDQELTLAAADLMIEAMVYASFIQWKRVKETEGEGRATLTTERWLREAASMFEGIANELDVLAKRAERN